MRDTSARKNIGAVLSAIFWPLTLLYYETVLKLSTVGQVTPMNMAWTALFCIVYGLIVYLLTTAFQKRLVNRVLTVVLLIVTALLYLASYFLFQQFNDFYDLNTSLGGATDALGSFSDMLFHLLFTWQSLVRFVLYLLPVALYLLGCRFLSLDAPSAVSWRIGAAVGSVAVLVTTTVLLGANPVYGPMYDREYRYSTAVSEFGLMTGLRLDITHMLKKDDYRFEQPSQEVVGTTASPSTTTASNSTALSSTQTATTTYGRNEITLTFSTQKASASHKELDAYVQSLTPSSKNAYTGLFKGKNLIMISAEAFSGEVISPTLTPTLYRLATKGIQFTEYYQPASAGTTGGEYQNLFGMMPTDGGMSFKNTQDHCNYYTIGSQLDRLGYYGKAYHNNDYTYYDRHLTHNNLGYSDGFTGYGNGMEAYVNAQWPQSDLEMIAGTLPTFIDKQPFNVYYMSVSGHSDYTPDSNAMTRKHWERVKYLPYSDTVKGYIAANLELEDALTYLVTALENAGIADDTVICLTTDHFPYGLDADSPLGKMPYLSELYGYEVDTYFERDHSALILWSGCLEERDPIVVDAPTFSLDILPTLSNLFGTEFDSRLLPGRDVFSDAPALVFNSNYDWKTAYGTYYASSGTFVPTDESVAIPEGYVDNVKATVRNKMNYCAGVLDTDYFAHLFER